MDNTDNDGLTGLRVAASNVHLEVPQQLLSNGGNMHIARKLDLTILLAAADSEYVGVVREFLKHHTCVSIAI